MTGLRRVISMRLFDSWIALFDLLWLYQGMSFGFGISLDFTTVVLASAGTILPFAPADCRNNYSYVRALQWGTFLLGASSN